MFESKYNKLLTAILVVVIIGIIILLSFFGYDVYKKMADKQAIAEIVDQVDNTVPENEEVATNTDFQVLNETTQTSTTTGKLTYKGYNVLGTIEIPKIDLKYPILERVTTESIEASVAILYGPGPNQVGNTVIVGHNYRNGSFFGNNDKLSLNDKIYITDLSGTRIEYKIYNIYETSPDDGDYMTRDTNGKREISLSTCTDNSKQRLIIWAVED